MRYLVCALDLDPCPAESIQSLPFLDTVDFGSMGINPETVLSVFAWGFASVFMFFLLGWGLGLAVGLIRKF